MPRPTFLALLLVALGSCGSSEARSRNLLLVVFDTTRADHLSAYGYDKPTTPRLEALVRRGARFEQARSTSSLTPVSAASFLTGELPVKTDVRSLLQLDKAGLSPAVAPLAELLAASGRATAAFVSAPPIGRRYGFARGFDVFDDDVSEQAAVLRAQKVGNVFQRRADATTDRALEWLTGSSEAAPSRPNGQPFGLMVHYFDAHDPSLVPPRAFLEPRVSFELPVDLDARPQLVELFAGASPGQPVPRANDLIELYDAELEYMDTQLGRILDALKASGELAHTLVVVIADHGESLGQHNFWSHGLMWDEQLHVPLILAGPGVPAGLQLDDLVSLTDLVPSLAGLLDFEVPGGLHGRSFAGLFDPATARNFVQRPVISEVHNSRGDRNGRPPALFAVTALPWKLIVEPGQPTRLFDLEADPLELNNLYTEQHPAARALATMLAVSGALAGDPSGQPPSLEELDPEQREILEKLGYL